ncbi:hypothetical protein Q9233_011419, partial [Columba guinea]
MLSPGGHDAAAKPGMCPVVLRGSLGPCLELCDTDSDCTGPAKCCTTGCGHVCKPPIEGKAICGSETPTCSLSAAELQPPITPGTPTRDFKPSHSSAVDTHIIPSSTMRPGVFLLLGLLILRADLGTAPEETGDKPGKCPKVRPRRPPESCAEQDSCSHDRDCPRQEKCCFSGCAMRCARPAREHPGECPPAQPCWDPRRRHRSRCLDDSVCRREEKCCDTGCGWDCVAMPR